MADGRLANNRKWLIWNFSLSYFSQSTSVVSLEWDKIATFHTHKSQLIGYCCCWNSQFQLIIIILCFESCLIVVNGRGPRNGCWAVAIIKVIIMNRNYKLSNKRHANSDYAMNGGLKLKIKATTVRRFSMSEFFM